MIKKNNKAQAWSIDIIIGVILFLILIVVVYTLVATSPLGNLELRRNADNIYTKLDETKNEDPNIPKIISGNIIKDENIQQLLEKDYNELKNALGITGDFCIVITYTHGGIHNLSTTNQSYGNPNHDLIIGKTGTETIYCGK